MSSRYYYLDEVGKYQSEDGKTKYSMVEGNRLYDFLNAPENAKRHFITFTDDNGDKIGVETTPELRLEFRKENRHTRYMNYIRDEKQFAILSLDTVMSEYGEEMNGEEVTADPDTDVVAEVMHQLDLETLRKALHSLSAQEIELIQALFLCENPMSERAYARELKIPQKTLNCRKQAVLAKLRKYF